MERRRTERLRLLFTAGRVRSILRTCLLYRAVSMEDDRVPFRNSPDETKRRIMIVAVALFAHKGYSATTTREIVEQAGVTKPMLYYYFEDKQDLYMTIVRGAMEALLTDLRIAVTQETVPVEQLRRYVRAYLRFFLANREVGAICFQEMFGLGENLVRELNPVFFDQVRSLMDEVIAGGRHANRYTAEELDYIALSLLGIPNMFVMRLILHGEGCDVERVAERVVDYYIAEVEAPVREQS